MDNLGISFEQPWKGLHSQCCIARPNAIWPSGSMEYFSMGITIYWHDSHPGHVYRTI